MNEHAPASVLSGESRLLDWWMRELSGLTRRSENNQGGWTILVQPEADGLTVHRRQRNAIDTFKIATAQAALEKKLAAPPQQVVLRLKPHDVVRRTLSLPNGERRDLEAIIRNQLEFLAPWPVEKVLFDYEVQPSAAPDDRLVPVVVTMTGRDLVEAAQQKLAGLGIRAGVVDAGDSTDAPVTINLLRSNDRDDDASVRGVRLVMAGLLALTLAVAAAGGAKAFLAYRELSAVDAAIQSIRSAADEAQKLSAASAELRAKSERLAKRKESDAPTMLVIEALSRTLPTDTWLTNVEVRGRDVRILGKSPNATALIGLLEGSKGFAKVRFAAPTTREAGQEIDTFSIVAETAKVAELIR